MSPEPILRLFDNPICIAQARRRLRRRQALPTFVVIGLVGLCVMLMASASEASGPDGEAWRLASQFFLIVITIVLCFRGTGQVSGTLAEDRASGLLDFHRATPTSAWTDALGYAAGCAAREYSSALLLAPFFLLSSILAGHSIVTALLALYHVLATGFLCHVFGMFMGLTGNGRRVARSAVTSLVVVFFVASPLASLPFIAVGHVTPLPALISLGVLDLARTPVPELTFFGVPCSHVSFTLLFQGYLLAFLSWATARRLRSETAHAFSRVGGLAFFGLTTLFLLGPAWNRFTDAGFVATSVGLFLVIGVALASALAFSLVPTFLETLRSVRRARRFGRRVPWLEDGASAWPLVPCFLALLMIGVALVAWRARASGALDSGAVPSREAVFALAGCGVFLAFVFGALEHFRLAWRAASRSGIFLVGFLSLALPWILGAALAPLVEGGQIWRYVIATSPLYSVGGAVTMLVQGIGGRPVDPWTGPVIWSLVVTAGAAAVLWRGAHRVRAAIESDEAATGDLPSIDAYRNAG